MNTATTVENTANATVDTVMENNTNTPKQIPYSIQSLLQIPQEQLTAAFPQNMVGFKTAYDKDNKFIPLKFIKALNKKLNIQTQWPVLDIKEKDQLYDEGYGFNFTYLTNDDKILVTYDMFIIISQLVHYDFKPYISVEIQNILQKYHTINWQINQNPPPPVVRPKTKKQTTKRQTTTKTQKQKLQNNENVQNNEEEQVNDVQVKKTQSKKVQSKKDQGKDDQNKNDTTANVNETANVDEQPKPKRRTTRKAKTQDILEQLNQNVGNNTASQNVDQQNIDQQQSVGQQNIIHEIENTIKQCETAQNDEPTTTDNINNLLTTTDQDNDLTEEELKTTQTLDLLDFDAL